MSLTLASPSCTHKVYACRFDSGKTPQEPKIISLNSLLSSDVYVTLKCPPQTSDVMVLYWGAPKLITFISWGSILLNPPGRIKVWKQHKACLPWKHLERICCFAKQEQNIAKQTITKSGAQRTETQWHDCWKLQPLEVYLLRRNVKLLYKKMGNLCLYILHVPCQNIRGSTNVLPSASCNGARAPTPQPKIGICFS